jgi:hypothetical protein
MVLVDNVIRKTVDIIIPIITETSINSNKALENRFNLSRDTYINKTGQIESTSLNRSIYDSIQKVTDIHLFSQERVITNLINNYEHEVKSNNSEKIVKEIQTIKTEKQTVVIDTKAMEQRLMSMEHYLKNVEEHLKHLTNAMWRTWKKFVG